MAISLDKAFGVHDQGLLLRTKRAEIIASNIANADTPGYKAKGMDFQKALEQASSQQKQSLARTHEKHFKMESSLTNSQGYRVPNQPDTGDGNTVDSNVERNLYLQNQLEYQASYQFLNSKIVGIKKALKGGK